MAKKPVSKEGSRSFKVTSPVKFDGADYAPGDDIDLDFSTWEQLTAANAIEGEWKAEPAPSA